MPPLRYLYKIRDKPAGSCSDPRTSDSCRARSARLTIANNLPPTVKTDQRLAKGKAVITVAAGPDAPMRDTVRYDIRGARNAGLRPIHFDPH